MREWLREHLELVLQREVVGLLFPADSSELALPTDALLVGWLDRWTTRRRVALERVQQERDLPRLAEARWTDSALPVAAKLKKRFSTKTTDKYVWATGEEQCK